MKFGLKSTKPDDFQDINIALHVLSDVRILYTVKIMWIYTYLRCVFLYPLYIAIISKAKNDIWL